VERCCSYGFFFVFECEFDDIGELWYVYSFFFFCVMTSWDSFVGWCFYWGNVVCLVFFFIFFFCFFVFCFFVLLIPSFFFFFFLDF